MLELDKIHCGDNCDLLGQLPRECIDLVVTSPPYDDLRTYGGHSWDFFGVAWHLKRVLKPGGRFVGYEWCLTDKFNKHDKRHQQIKADIELGNGACTCDLSLGSEGRVKDRSTDLLRCWLTG